MRNPFKLLLNKSATAALAVTTLALLVLSSCTNTMNAPVPGSSNPTNTLSVDELFTPPPSGNADDYFVLNSGDDDVEYSYFLDEQDYFDSRDKKGNDHFSDELVKNGHGYGDHNHIHEYEKGEHHYHGDYHGNHEDDWTDSLQFTDIEKLQIDTAMKQFHVCADASLDSFKVALKPFRAEFRLKKIAILATLDSGKITRDSARTLLDSAIATYLSETSLLRKSLAAEVKVCLTELDAYLVTRLTPAQYAIWLRHRGW